MREGRADEFAQVGGGAGESQRARGVSASAGEAGVAFERAGNTAAVAEFEKKGHGFVVGVLGGGVAALGTVNVAKIGERASAAPAVVGGAKGGEGLLVEFAGVHQVALLIDGPGSAAAVAEVFKDMGGFAESAARAGKIALGFIDAGEIVEAASDGKGVAKFAPAGEAAFEVAFGEGDIAAIPARNGEGVERSGDAGLIAEEFIDEQALLERVFGAFVVALGGAERADEVEDAAALAGVGFAGEAEGGFEAFAAFGEMFPHIPEAEESDAEAKRPFDLARCEEPIEGGAEIVNFKVALGKPARAVAGGKLGIPFLGKNETVRSVGAAHGRFVAAFGEALDGVFADHLEHGEAGFAVGAIHALEKILIHERRKAVEEVHAEIAGGIADGFGGFERAAADESGEAAEEAALGLVEEIVAPVNRVAKGLLAFGKIEGAAGEELEAALEAIEDSGGRKNAGAGGGELDRQREAVEARADVADGGSVIRRDGKVRADGGSALDEKFGCGIGREGGDWKILLAVDAEAGAAGGENFERGAGFERFGEKFGGGENLFEIIEDEQEGASVAKLFGDDLGDGTAAEGLDGEGFGKSRSDEIGIGDRAEANEFDARGKTRGESFGDGDGEARLPRSAGTRESEKENVGTQKKFGGLSDLKFAADERSARARKFVAFARRASGLGRGSGDRRALDRRGRSGGSGRRDFRAENVAATRNGFDELLSTIAEGAAKFDDALDERIVGDEGIGPDGLGELFLADKAAGILNEILKSFENLGAKLDLAARLEETPAVGI